MARDRNLRKRYNDDGFVVVPDVLTAAAVAKTLDETLRVCKGECGPVEGLAPASSFTDDRDLMARHLAIHFPHKISSWFYDLLGWPSIADALCDVIGPNVKCMQSMLFVKAPGKPGQAWHQDENYIPTRDRSLCGVWIALDDASIDNGCLWVLPQSQTHGVVWPSKRTARRISTRDGRASAIPRTSPMRFRSNCRPEARCSSTGTYCTSRCRTAPPIGFGGRSSITTRRPSRCLRGIGTGGFL
jgi:phytanoyl-CoA hydroxylase